MSFPLSLSSLLSSPLAQEGPEGKEGGATCRRFHGSCGLPSPPTALAEDSALWPKTELAAKTDRINRIGQYTYSEYSECDKACCFSIIKFELTQ